MRFSQSLEFAVSDLGFQTFSYPAPGVVNANFTFCWGWDNQDEDNRKLVLCTVLFSGPDLLSVTFYNPSDGGIGGTHTLFLDVFPTP